MKRRSFLACGSVAALAPSAVADSVLAVNAVAQPSVGSLLPPAVSEDGQSTSRLVPGAPRDLLAEPASAARLSLVPIDPEGVDLDPGTSVHVEVLYPGLLGRMPTLAWSARNDGVMNIGAGTSLATPRGAMRLRVTIRRTSGEDTVHELSVHTSDVARSPRVLAIPFRAGASRPAWRRCRAVLDESGRTVELTDPWRRRAADGCVLLQVAAEAAPSDGLQDQTAPEQNGEA